MDLYNNGVGIKIAQENPNASPEEIAQLIKKAVDEGDMIVIDQQGQFAWSDQAPVVLGEPQDTGSSGSHSY